MSLHTSNLARLARELAESKLQKEQQHTEELSRHLERLEEKLAIYRYHALVANPNPPPSEWEAPRFFSLPEEQPKPAWTSPQKALAYHAEQTAIDTEKRKTVLVIDNGGMNAVIEQMSYAYQVYVWRMENSRQPLPEVDVQVDYLPVVEIDHETCVQKLTELQQADAAISLLLVDGFIWQTPLIVAADMGIPVILCFEKSVNAAYLSQQWYQSNWRVVQSFIWSFGVLCTDEETASFFISKNWLPSKQNVVVQEIKKRTTDWWHQQISQWRQRYAHFIEQVQFLEKQDIDWDYFIGQESWRRNNTRTQQLVNFLFSWRMQLYMRQLVPGFDMCLYAQAHPNLHDTHPFVDYLKRNKPTGPWSRRLISPTVNAGKTPTSAGLALHIHAYYIESLPFIMKGIQRNLLRPHLFISVRNQEDKEQAHEICKHYAFKVEIRVVPNRGRDIGAFLTEFGPELVANYEIIGHLHTKQSLFHTERDFIFAWQEFLLSSLLGDATHRMMDEIVDVMQKHPAIGIVFPDDPNIGDWGKNKEYAQLLMEQMGFEANGLPHRGFKFPIGTMFWIRAEVLKPLVDLNLDWHDYPSEPLAPDGSILHALERVFGLLAEQIGMQTALTYIPGVSR